jgi:hypothetical protein
MPFDGLLNVVNREMRQVALVLLAAAAVEVKVFATVAFSADENEAVPAAGTPQRSLEEVLVLACPRASAAAYGEHALHPFKDLFRDERFMAAGVFLAAILNDSQEVPVSQDFVDLR